MELLGKFKSETEVIAGIKPMSLDEVYAEASSFGEVRIGGTYGPMATEIKLHDVGDHFVCVKCRKHHTIQANLAECMDAARRIRSVL